MAAYTWNTAATPTHIAAALSLLSVEYPLIPDSPAAVLLTFEPCVSAHTEFKIIQHPDAVCIQYSNLTAALRAVGSILAESFNHESTSFKSIGIMLDCSRGAVMKTDHLKKWLRRLALLGYNMAMLYTEDTYQLPDEPYFGYKRGPYSFAELRDLDEYAETLGIELTGCIQTLAHLMQLLKWPAYAEVKDTWHSLLIGSEKTYALLDKAIANFAAAYRSRRIHIGMDEAESFGRGRYLDFNPFKPSYDLFLEHLVKVVALCQKHGLKPMLWSDMFFRIASKTHDYYDLGAVIPDSVKSAIPASAQLVYWDYYHDDPGFYTDFIARHKSICPAPVLASGVWTWNLFWYNHRLTQANALAAICAAKKTALPDIFFCLWGDDGQYCDFDSAFTGLALCAEHIYRDSPHTALLARRFAAICKGDYHANCIASDLSIANIEGAGTTRSGWTDSALFWEDPLLQGFWHNKCLLDPAFPQMITKHYASLVIELENTRAAQDPRLTEAGDLALALIVARILAAKCRLCSDFAPAYKCRDFHALRQVRSVVAAIIPLFDEFDSRFRANWLARNKPFGLEVIQNRIAGLARRYREFSDRVTELIDGKILDIPEYQNQAPAPTAYGISYQQVANTWYNL
jgi:hypothetical protein